MPNYRRATCPGGAFFFTVVTHDRRAFLTEPMAHACLREVMEDVQRKMPFVVVAMCLLPEHLHCVWILPDGDSDYSARWRAIKGLFTRRYLARGGWSGKCNRSRLKRGEAAVWQRRFWEHLIRDELDMARHVDYVHFNPVKHGHVCRAADWPWSTFLRHVREGQYDTSWGEVEPDWMRDFRCVGE